MVANVICRRTERKAEKGGRTEELRFNWDSARPLCGRHNRLSTKTLRQRSVISATSSTTGKERRREAVPTTMLKVTRSRETGQHLSGARRRGWQSRSRTAGCFSRTRPPPWRQRGRQDISISVPDPHEQPFWAKFDLLTRTDILCGANGLTYGTDYGQGFYSSSNVSITHHTLKAFPHVSTFKELAECIGNVISTAKRHELHPRFSGRESTSMRS